MNSDIEKLNVIYLTDTQIQKLSAKSLGILTYTRYLQSNCLSNFASLAKIKKRFNLTDKELNDSVDEINQLISLDDKKPFTSENEINCINEELIINLYKEFIKHNYNDLCSTNNQRAIINFVDSIRNILYSHYDVKSLEGCENMTLDDFIESLNTEELLRLYDLKRMTFYAWMLSDARHRSYDDARKKGDDWVKCQLKDRLTDDANIMLMAKALCGENHDEKLDYYGMFERYIEKKPK